ncbi:MAG: histidine phosphatase family protein [Acidobacteriota bacterium]|nr:histidine phosphatase family protein [Acidobacteriota bacterium]
MNLYILRHASAGVRRVNPVLDLKRPLDKDGKRHCLHLAHILNGMKLSFDLVVSSPLKRCMQTASLVGTETGYELPILPSSALAPAAALPDFQKLLAELQAGRQPSDNVLLVGHNPNLSTFLGSLLVLPTEASCSACIRLRKGSLARLNLLQSGPARGPAMLQWLLDPRIVRAIYATSTTRSRRKTSRK